MFISGGKDVHVQHAVNCFQFVSYFPRGFSNAQTHFFAVPITGNTRKTKQASGMPFMKDFILQISQTIQNLYSQEAKPREMIW